MCGLVKQTAIGIEEDLTFDIAVQHRVKRIVCVR